MRIATDAGRAWRTTSPSVSDGLIDHSLPTPQSDETAFLDGPPVLAVEILSPSDKHEEIGERIVVSQASCPAGYARLSSSKGLKLPLSSLRANSRKVPLRRGPADCNGRGCRIDKLLYPLASPVARATIHGVRGNQIPYPLSVLHRGVVHCSRSHFMPLLDHFHPPISERRSCEGFHGLWAAALVEKLNRDILTEEYYADMQVHVGSQVEVDIASLAESRVAGDHGNVPTATVTRVWTPPATELVLPTVFPDDIEVQVFATIAGATLVGAIELVSPGNKDRPEARQAFAAKCVCYLTRGIGLIVVDIVTNRLVNLHNQVIGLLGHGQPFLLPPSTTTYAVAYRPSRQPTGDQIELWPKPLCLGQPLPVLPLGLRNAAAVPVDLDETYREACKRSRLG